MSDRSSLFRKKLQDHPDNHLFRFSLSQALFDEGRLDACMDELELCLEARPDWMIACLLLGKAKIRTGNLKDARKILEETIRIAQEQSHEGPEEEARSLLRECQSSE